MSDYEKTVLVWMSRNFAEINFNIKIYSKAKLTMLIGRFVFLATVYIVTCYDTKSNCVVGISW